MKKNLTKIISILLALAMAAGLSGCGNEKSKLLGTWETTVNLADYVNQGAAEADESVAQYLAVDSFYLTVVLTFKENDTFSMALDESTLSAAVEQYKQDIRGGMEQYLIDLMASMGVEMTIDQIMEATGFSMDELLDQAFTEEMLQQIIDNAGSEGKFKAKAGKLYFSAGPEYEVDENVYGNYKLEGNTLTLLDYTDEDDSFLGMYPLTFTKVA